MSSTTLSQCLKTQKAQFLRDGGQRWTVVMGNEAGDLDTIASSIGYAWYRSQYDDGGKAVALLPMPRADFTLRAENIRALALAGVTPPFGELLCPEDLPVDKKWTDFALVDHNVLDTRYSSPTARVVAIIDHHEDEGKHRDTASPRIIESCGSCASLVTRLIMSSTTKKGHTQIPPELAALLLSAIVIDTHGLRKGGKAVDADRVAAAWLLPQVEQVQSISPEIHPTDVWTDTPERISENPMVHLLANELDSEKRAVSHLSTRDLLRRDYKEYTFEHPVGSIQVGLATVPLSLSTFFKSGSTSVVTATTGWMAERHLSVLGVLTTYRSKKDKGRREQLWIVNEKVGDTERQGLAYALFHGLKADKTLKLKRVGFDRYGFGTSGNDGMNEDDEHESDDAADGDEVDSIAVEDSPFDKPFVARVYKQKNTHATRKQVAPALKQILEG